MNDTKLRAAYAELLDARRDVPAKPVSLDRILDLVEGRGSEADRIATLDSVMADREMTREMELLRSLAANRPAAPSVRHWRLAVPLLAAAAALLLIAVPATREALMGRGGDAEPLRDITQGPALMLPAEVASEPDSRLFRWRSIAGARNYALEILTAAGTAVFTTRTTDTTVTLPADVKLAPDVDHRWWVAAELSDGTVRRSPFRRLRLNAARPQ